MPGYNRVQRIVGLRLMAGCAGVWTVLLDVAGVTRKCTVQRRDRVLRIVDSCRQSLVYEESGGDLCRPFPCPTLLVTRGFRPAVGMAYPGVR
jgi:hypothetical protein